MESRKTGEVRGLVGRKFNLFQNEVPKTHPFFRIWEKKFGSHANHVVKQRDTSKASNRAHLSSGGTPIRKDQFRGGRSNSDGAPVAGRKARIPNRSRDDFSVSRTSGVRKEDKPLHPSWEAKKRLQNVAIVPAQGTRIVFD